MADSNRQQSSTPTSLSYLLNIISVKLMWAFQEVSSAFFKLTIVHFLDHPGGVWKYFIRPVVEKCYKPKNDHVIWMEV